MKILLIARGIPDAHEPQWGCFEKDQAEALAAMGHQVVMAAVDTRFRFYWRPLGTTIRRSDSVVYYNYFLCPTAIVSLLGRTVSEKFLKWQWRKLYEKILQQEGEFDIIYSHYLFNTKRASDAIQGKPIVGIEHWSELNKERIAPQWIKMGKETYLKIDKLLAVSKALQRNIQQQIGVDSEVVYNMMGSGFYYDPAQRPSDDCFTMVSTGRLVAGKGFDLLIEALHKLQFNTPWKLYIIGAGGKRAALQRLIDKYHLTEQMRLVGAKTKPEIIAYLQQSHAFVLPSYKETFGVVYIEAMACGLPVIATRCGGPEEFVDENNGLLIPVDDVDALAEAIKYMYTHHQDYDRVAIAQECQRRFSSEVIAKQLTDIFEDVLHQRQQQKG